MGTECIFFSSLFISHYFKDVSCNKVVMCTKYFFLRFVSNRQSSTQVTVQISRLDCWISRHGYEAASASASASRSRSILGQSFSFSFVVTKTQSFSLGFSFVTWESFDFSFGFLNLTNPKWLKT